MPRSRSGATFNLGTVFLAIDVFVFVSARDDRSAGGMHGYVSKPIDAVGLAREIHHVLSVSPDVENDNQRRTRRTR